LKRYQERFPSLPAESDPSPTQPLWTERGEAIWEVDDLLERRLHREAHWRKYKGRDRWYPPQYEYRVSWKGHPGQDSWEPRSALRGAALDLADYLDLALVTWTWLRELLVTPSHIASPSRLPTDSPALP
jgi:hypothetical protein